MRGINVVVIAGNVADEPRYDVVRGEDVAAFSVVVERHSASGHATTIVKVSVYARGLVEVCRPRLHKGLYVTVQGELMNRDGPAGRLLEVRAREIIIAERGKQA